MEPRQKFILHSISLLVITAIAVVGMFNLRDWVKRSEAVRAMEHLSRIVRQYRTENGSVPPESYVDNIKENLEGYVRIGKLHYRAMWIDLETTPDEILAYSKQNCFFSIVGEGVVVLRLDGRVEWMNTQEFELLLAQQQSPEEIRMLQQ